MPSFDRRAANIGNIVSLEHVNTTIPDQQLAVIFYVTRLGLTRDPYLMTGTGNMWINVGLSQFHLPTQDSQVVRGRTGIVMPGRDALLDRLESVAGALNDTAYSFAAGQDYVDTTCPWGNRIRCHQPSDQFGDMALGMAYVEFDVPMGKASGIARFYEHIMGAPIEVREETGGLAARVEIGSDQALIFRETDAAPISYDGHHVAIYLRDFFAPYQALAERGLISQEDSDHQYRFVDIVDPKSGERLFQLEHEVRSMRHSVFLRPLVNRNPTLTDFNYAPGHEDLAWKRFRAG